MKDNFILEKTKDGAYYGICGFCSYRESPERYPVLAIQTIQKHMKEEGCDEAPESLLAN
jgi:hypothetical protein